MTDRELEVLLYDWHFWARPKQLAPYRDHEIDNMARSIWRTWIILAGRGFGKTRTGAEWVRYQVEFNKKRRIALVAPTAADARDVMVEGESGILAICPPWNRPIYEPSKRRLTWPNGAIATTYSADEPNRLRGPQHDAAWADELAAWRYPETWDQLKFGLRLGVDPQVVVTTTPRPIPIIKELVKDPTTVVTRGSTFENRGNLAQVFLDDILRKYQGTRLGRQELYAELLEDTPGALWNLTLIEAYRHTGETLPQFSKLVIGVDPSATSNENSDETGIIVAGKTDYGHGFVLDDLTLVGTPLEWARAAVAAYKRFEADKIVAETNNGGEMVTYTIHTVDGSVPIRAVHASRGKRTRAEPVSSLYEQGLVHHVGNLSKLEDQMCSWVPGEDSPDRMDALVWALTDLMLGDDTITIGQAPEVLRDYRG